jgi:hypothetical protein
MKIPLQEALDLIEAADVVKLFDVSGYIIPHITTVDIRGSYDNEVMLITWNTNGQDYAIRTPEEGNKEVERDGHKLIFVDDEGEQFELHLFREVPISLPLQDYLN